MDVRKDGWSARILEWKEISIETWKTDIIVLIGLLQIYLQTSHWMENYGWDREPLMKILLKVLNSKNGDWSQIGYYMFDIPSSPGTYEERMEEMETIQSILPSHVHVVENIQCTGKDHLQEYLDSIVAAKGEGVMLRKPNTRYEIGYTSSLLKVKVSIISVAITH